MSETDHLDLRDPRTLFKLWKELTGEDILCEDEKKLKSKDVKT
ncbi:MAG: hypothetical protein M0Z77_04200 [Thermoplasmatales archaeon]|jgi:hypothetical protein|nr:hypothetical protein [Thermoplasmatales archaeon]